MKSFRFIQFLFPSFSNFLHELLRFLQSFLNSVGFDALHSERRSFWNKNEENQHFRKVLILTEREIHLRPITNHDLAIRISFTEMIIITVSYQSLRIIRTKQSQGWSIQFLTVIIKQNNILIIIITTIRPVLPQWASSSTCPLLLSAPWWSWHWGPRWPRHGWQSSWPCRRTSGWKGSPRSCLPRDSRWPSSRSSSCHPSCPGEEIIISSC